MRQIERLRFGITLHPKAESHNWPQTPSGMKKLEEEIKKRVAARDGRREAHQQQPTSKARAKPKRESLAEQVYRQRREAAHNVAGGESRASGPTATARPDPPARRARGFAGIASEYYGTTAAGAGELIGSTSRGGETR